MPPDSPSPSPPRWPTACAIALGVAVVLLGTTGPLPMVWDEGIYIERAEQTAAWFGKLFRGDLTMLGDGAIAQHWRCTTQAEGHPGLYLWLISAGRTFGGAVCSVPVAARLGNILLAAVAAGAVFYRLQREYGDWAARCAVVALLAQPRLFAHLHYATLDGPLTSLWLLAWATFDPEREGRCAALAWGAVLGLLLSIKFPGWLAVPVFVFWAAVYRDRRAFRMLALGLPVALLVFWLLNPPLWHHPLSGTWEFLRMNVSRGARPELNITTWFLGEMYDTTYSLPWYNTLLWLFIAVPVGVLLLAGCGLAPAVASLAQRKLPQAAVALVIMHWLLLLVVRALPGVPPHDGIRLFLPSFGFLAVLAGLGAAELTAWIEARWPTARAKIAHAVPVALLLTALASVFWYAPQQLSYYSLLCGGQRGAAALGMEPAYYWEGLDAEVLAWLDEHTADDQTVRFSAGPRHNLQLLRSAGYFSFKLTSDDDFRWYVMQNRPGAFSEADDWLIVYGTPAYAKTIRPAGLLFGPWRLDVPVVLVFDRAEYERGVKHVEMNTR